MHAELSAHERRNSNAICIRRSENHAIDEALATQYDGSNDLQRYQSVSGPREGNLSVDDLRLSPPDEPEEGGTRSCKFPCTSLALHVHEPTLTLECLATLGRMALIEATNDLERHRHMRTPSDRSMNPIPEDDVGPLQTPSPRTETVMFARDYSVAQDIRPPPDSLITRAPGRRYRSIRTRIHVRSQSREPEVRPQSYPSASISTASAAEQRRQNSTPTPIGRFGDDNEDVGVSFEEHVDEADLEVCMDLGPR